MKMRPLTIAVDFDGTCVTHEFPRVGREIGAPPALRKLVAAGHRLILWTMRSGNRKDGSDPLADAVAWFAKHEIPLFGINSNPEQGTWTESPKAYANLYIDDAALGAPLIEPEGEDRPYINWKKVERMLLPKKRKRKTTPQPMRIVKKS